MKRMAIMAAWAVAGSLAWGQQGEQPRPAPAASSPAILLEKGIYTEETVGDLDAAIKIYRQIVSDAKANRNCAVQAKYRLGMCYLKKKQNAQAIKCFNELIAAFPDRKELVAKARDQLAKARGGMSDAEIARIVADVVTDISTMADGDPRIPGLLKSLRELPEPAVVKELTKHFGSDKNTVRRAAIYVFWKGEFADASPAVPGLVKLCRHEEDYTRGMAALALGKLKAGGAFDTLAKMTANDKTSFARRCAAYALGMLGDPRAKPILEQALKDSDKHVRNNAEAGLTLLAKQAKADDIPRLPANVMGYIIGQHFQGFAVAKAKGLHVNTHIYGVDDRFNLYQGGLLVHHNDTDKPQPGPIHLGNFGPKKKDFFLSDEQGREQAYEYRENPGRARGKWGLWWKPDKPVQPGTTRLLGYLDKRVRPLPHAGGVGRLEMTNFFGSAVLESFFLVVPPNVAPAEGPPAPKSKVAIEDFVIYLWQDQVAANTNHKVTVALARTHAAGATRELSRDDGTSVGRRSIAGAAQGVAFEAPPGARLTAVRIYGSRYGTPAPPAEDFRVWITDAKSDNKLAEFKFPYARFERGDPKWMTLEVPPTPVPKEFRVFVDFNAERTKGVYVHYDAKLSGPSFIAGRDGKVRPFGNGDWMIRAVVTVGKRPPPGEAATPIAAEAVKAAVPAAEAWLKLVDEGKYAESWAAAAGLFRKALSKDKWLSSLRPARRPLGKVQSREVLSAQYHKSLPGAPDGHYVVIQFKTSFANKPEAVETITPMKETDGQWRVSGYYVK